MRLFQGYRIKLVSGRIIICGGGGTCTGAPSFTCGVSTVTGLDGKSYATVTGEDGRCWFATNLGTTHIATSYNDALSYGSLYQWGRSFDGHQATTSTIGGEATIAAAGDYLPASCSGNCTAIASPYTSYFATSTGNWLPSQNNNLWDDANYTNNVCPSGWHVPTQLEWATWTNAAGLTTGAGSGSNGSTACGSTCNAKAANSNLKLSEAGFRSNSDGSLVFQGSGGYYWSSSPDGAYAYLLGFGSASVGPAGNNYRAYGFSVRCIKN
jgi:uncharacterized protein (TIGR02145 family)